MKDSFDSLLREDHPPIQFWQTPAFIVGEFAISFGIGALLVASHCFGACK